MNVLPTAFKDDLLYRNKIMKHEMIDQIVYSENKAGIVWRPANLNSVLQKNIIINDNRLHVPFNRQNFSDSFCDGLNSDTEKNSGKQQIFLPFLPSD